MNKLQVIIIEDEVPAARLLHSMVKSVRPDWEVTIVPGGVDEASEWLAAHEQPDLIFLDIHLADGNAFDLLSSVKPKSPIIFTTAYDQYAIRAFAVNSIDYILKPIDGQRLEDAIVKYENFCSRGMPWPDDYLDLLMDALRQREKRYRTRFLISGTNDFWMLQVSDIAYFYSENKVTFAVTKKGQEHILDFSLNKLEEQLDPASFFRVNRQMIVGVEAIDHAAPFFNRKIVVSVKPPFKSQVTVSEEKISAFKLWLNY